MKARQIYTWETNFGLDDRPSTEFRDVENFTVSAGLSFDLHCCFYVSPNRGAPAYAENPAATNG
jgi:hypothetical protein